MIRRTKSGARDQIRRRRLPTASHPSKALELLRNRALIEWAADPWHNPYWHHARATTRGRDEQTVLDAFPTRDATKCWTDRAEAFLQLDPAGMKANVPPLKVVALAKKPPWDPHYDEVATRDIVIPCVLRRVLSAHLAYILSITAQVSTAARAYVPGVASPAPTVVREVAARVQRGHYYYAKFDLRDAFNSVGWAPLRKALKRASYPQRFIQILMALVEAPLERRVRGRWLRQHRWRGTPAGLPESGILLNLLLREMDDRILRECDVYYARYSDDHLLVGATREGVAHAAKILLNWAWSVGFDIKGVPRHSDPTAWVKDIREEPLELLGVKIDHQADCHIPQHKIDGHVSKLAHFEQQALRTPRLIAAGSKYASWASGKRGIATADQDDLDALVDGFYHTWLPFNHAEAELFRSPAAARVSFGNLRQGDGPHRKLFAALLGPQSAHSLLRVRSEVGSPSSCPNERIALEVLSMVEDCLQLDPEVREADRRRRGASTLGMRGDSLVGESPHSPPPVLGWSEQEEQSFFLGIHSEGMIVNGGSALGTDPAPSPQGNGFDIGASGGRNAADASDTAPAEPVVHPTRHMGWTTGAAANAVYCFVTARSLLQRGSVITAFQEFEHDGLGLRPCRPCVREHTDTERAIAELHTIAARRRAAAARGRPFVVLGSNWLPKQLVVEQRSFRRIGIFALVTDLHRAAQREGHATLVIGPIRPPASLTAALDRWVAQAQSTQSVTPPP
jgi:hypothetical protein